MIRRYLPIEPDNCIETKLVDGVYVPDFSIRQIPVYVNLNDFTDSFVNAITSELEFKIFTRYDSSDLNPKKMPIIGID
jgi:hypothetical protein